MDQARRALMTVRLRIATFNLENLDEVPGQKPTLQERIELMRPQLMRLDADVLCLQEIHGQEAPGEPRSLLALKKLLEDTPYGDYHLVSTTVQNGGEVLNERNLVILSRYEVLESRQLFHEFVPALSYRKATAVPREEVEEVSWERPILHARIAPDDDTVVHVVNVHLKSKLPTDVSGQKLDAFTWKTASGWTEGSFLSSMKRVGQALETRMLVDELFDENANALVAVCGDFNADTDDVPVQAIRGDVEDTANAALARRVLVSCERTIPEPACYSYLHLGRRQMIDHLLVSRGLLRFYKGSEIHNELLHDESAAFAVDVKYPESDHAPVVAHFDLPPD
jgi:endonuclease/exonuclease/phosphatase family metal-dependent hydrolase